MYLSLRMVHGTHLPKLRVVFLPSSLNILLSLTLVFSTNPSVLIYGTAWLESHCEIFLVNRKFQNCPSHEGLCITAWLIISADFPADTIWQFAPNFTNWPWTSFSVIPQLLVHSTRNSNLPSTNLQWNTNLQIFKDLNIENWKFDYSLNIGNWSLKILVPCTRFSIQTK